MATLTSNVEVDGKWYGPSYPGNEATEDVLKKVTNPAAFAAPAPNPVDLRFTAADFGVEEGEQPHLRSLVPPTASASLEVQRTPEPPAPQVPTASEAAKAPEATKAAAKTSAKDKPSSDGG